MVENAETPGRRANELTLQHDYGGEIEEEVCLWIPYMPSPHREILKNPSYRARDGCTNLEGHGAASV